MYATYIQGPVEARRACEKPQIWSGGCEVQCRCWELILGFLEEQHKFITTEKSSPWECPLFSLLGISTYSFTGTTFVSGDLT